MYWLSFKKWDSSHGIFFVYERAYIRGYKWTPFIRVRKRYKTWLGYFQGPK